MTGFSCTPIGFVSQGVVDLRDDEWDSVTARIDLDGSRFAEDSTAGLDAFSHVEVLFLMDRVKPEEVVAGARHPRQRADWPKVGIFAQRAKARPNRIGATVCRLVRLDGLSLTVRGLDAVNGTPVLDIKPYMREFGARGMVRQPAWSTELMSNYWMARPEIDLRMFEQTPATIADYLRGAPQEVLDWQPAPDRFSIGMVLAHLAEVELETVVNRLRLIASEDNPVLPPYDQEAQLRSPRTIDAWAELDRFANRRTNTVAFLRDLPPSAMGRTGRHADLGVLRLDEVLTECLFHDLGHIRQILELYRARVLYPNMGGFQKYYTVKP